MCYILIYILVFFMLLSSLAILISGVVQKNTVFVGAGVFCTYISYRIFKAIPKNR